LEAAVKLFWKLSLVLFVLAFFSRSIAFAQTAETGALAGSVMDPSGAVVADASIATTNQAT
jgi:hypothetical protein